MALVRCKECGEDISTKAQACPKCGAKAPKKTSLFTWFVLIFIIFIVYASDQAPTTTVDSSLNKIKSTSSNGSKVSKILKKIPPPKPSWGSATANDEMTGKFSAYASSPTVQPTKRMSFPYGAVNAWLGVGCDSENEWVYIGFNSAPNLTNDETEDGYNLIRTRMKWNNEIGNVVLTQKWGAKFLHFRNASLAITNIAASSTALLELQWHGEQPAHFKFTLNGSSKALSEIRAQCKK